MESPLLPDKRKLQITASSVADLTAQLQQKLGLAQPVGVLVHDAEFDEDCVISELGDIADDRAKIKVVPLQLAGAEQAAVDAKLAAAEAKAVAAAKLAAAEKQAAAEQPAAEQQQQIATAQQVAAKKKAAPQQQKAAQQAAATDTKVLRLCKPVSLRHAYVCGRADRKLTHGTRIAVQGRGAGTVAGFASHWFGANEHVVRFDSGSTAKVKLRGVLGGGRSSLWPSSWRAPARPRPTGLLRGRCVRWRRPPSHAAVPARLPGRTEPLRAQASTTARPRYRKQGDPGWTVLYYGASPAARPRPPPCVAPRH